MRRYLIKDGDAEAGRLLTVDGEDHRYLTRVLRLGVGAEMDGTDSSGRACTLRIEKVDRTACRLRVVTVSRPEASPALLHLYQCLPKPARMDIIVRQVTEAGVCRFVPVVSEHSLPSPSAGRVERWRRISAEALQQCGRTRPMQIGESMTLSEVCTTMGDRVGVFFHEQAEGSRSLHEILREPEMEVGMVVGPEGGLADHEVAALRDAGFHQAYLGDTVLRVDTAAISGVQALSVIIRERQSWMK